MKNLTSKARIAFVIPAFNESGAIADVVSAVSVWGQAIVVNDGSTDNTAQIAQEAGAIVVEHKVNLGYDMTLASGLAKAVAEDFELAITVDGDGQHKPADIETILDELFDGADLVIGSRDRLQRFSERIFSWLSKKLWGIDDPLCGMKGYRIQNLTDIDSLYSYPSIGTEIAIGAVCCGWDVRQVPVSIRDRKDESRFGGGIRANWLISKAMLIAVLRHGPCLRKKLRIIRK